MSKKAITKYTAEFELNKPFLPADQAGSTVYVEATQKTYTWTGTSWSAPTETYTVATLPTGVQGDEAFVSDATTPTYLGALTGGGAVFCKVLKNATIWVSN